eukprot:gene32408-41097_t
MEAKRTFTWPTGDFVLFEPYLYALIVFKRCYLDEHRDAVLLPDRHNDLPNVRKLFKTSGPEWWGDIAYALRKCVDDHPSDLPTPDATALNNWFARSYKSSKVGNTFRDAVKPCRAEWKGMLSKRRYLNKFAKYLKEGKSVGIKDAILDARPCAGDVGADDVACGIRNSEPVDDASRLEASDPMPSSGDVGRNDAGPVDVDAGCGLASRVDVRDDVQMEIEPDRPCSPTLMDGQDNDGADEIEIYSSPGFQLPQARSSRKREKATLATVDMDSLQAVIDHELDIIRTHRDFAFARDVQGNVDHFDIDMPQWTTALKEH